MPTFNINYAEIGIFFGILLRLSIIIFMLPIFNNSQVPNNLKAGLVLAFSAMLYPYLKSIVAPLPLEPVSIAGIIIGEIIFGVIFGLCIQLIFSAFQVAGELISFEMGFGFAQTADPQEGMQVTLFSIWFQILATLLFFQLNGHHIIIRAIVNSFHTIPPGSFALDPALFNRVIGVSAQLFVIAIKIAAPVMIALLLAHLGMGLMAKFAPQINILATSFPLTIFLGVLFMSFSVLAWGNAIERFFKELYQLLQIIAA